MGRSNPFKVEKQSFSDSHVQSLFWPNNVFTFFFVFNATQVQGSSSSSQHRMSNILDKMTSSKKSVPLSSSSGKQNKGPVLKPLGPRAKTKVFIAHTSMSFLSDYLVPLGDTSSLLMVSQPNVVICIITRGGLPVMNAWRDSAVIWPKFHLKFFFENKNSKMASHLFCNRYCKKLQKMANIAIFDIESRKVQSQLFHDKDVLNIVIFDNPKIST